MHDWHFKSYKWITERTRHSRSGVSLASLQTSQWFWSETMPSRDNHARLALQKLQMNHRENTSLEKWGFFGKSTNLSTIIDPKRWFHWKSLNPNNQPLITAPWDQLITLPTVVNFFLLFTVLATTVNSSSKNNFRSDYYRHTPSMNVHIRSDKLAHKQPAPKLWESNIALFAKVSFIWFTSGAVL